MLSACSRQHRLIAPPDESLSQVKELMHFGELKCVIGWSTGEDFAVEVQRGQFVIGRCATSHARPTACSMAGVLALDALVHAIIPSSA